MDVTKLFTYVLVVRDLVLRADGKDQRLEAPQHVLLVG